MKTTLEGSVLFEYAGNGRQVLMFVGKKTEKGKVAHTTGSVETIVSAVTHADWFCYREFAPKVRIIIEPLEEEEIWKFTGLGACLRNGGGEHKLRAFSFPNPEHPSCKEEKSVYEFQCVYCKKIFKLPHDKVKQMAAERAQRNFGNTPLCLECGARAACYCKRGGGKNNFDEFVLVCPKCGHKQSSKKPIGSPDALLGVASDEFPKCPFCGAIATQHTSPP